MKRGFDVIVAFGLLLLTWPIILIAALIVRLESPGRGFFAQERVGLKESVFVCYKLRSMAVGTKNVGTHEVSEASITRIGGMLRKTKLDELPQLWNVIKGDMSLVGPRPCLPTQDEVIEERRKRGVYRIRPGITGLSQIEGVDMSTPEKLAELDARYMENQSFLFDIRLLIHTALGKGGGDRMRRGKPVK